MRDPANHRGEDLAGSSFVNAMLDGADFGEADLRGSDFTRASLTGADFTASKLGLRPLASGVMLVASLLVVAATGWLIGWTLHDLIDGVGDAAWEEILGRGLAVAMIGVLLVGVIAFGLAEALRYAAAFTVAALIVNYVVIGVTSQNFDFARDGRVLGALLVLFMAMIAGGIARVVGGTFSTGAIVVVGLVGGFAAGQAGGGIAGVVVSVLLVVLAKRTLRVDQRDRFARHLVHRIISLRGTRFTGADLTGADFTGAMLAQSDLTGARLADAVLTNIDGWPPYLEEVRD